MKALALNSIVNPLSPLGPDNFNLATTEGLIALQELIYNLDVLI